MDNTLGTNIRTRRAQLGMTLAQLGEAVGIGATGVGKIEGGGGTTTARLQLFAQALQCQPANLLDPNWLPALEGAEASR